MRIVTWLKQQKRTPILAAIILLVLVLGWIDYLTGIEIAFSVFYFLPVAGASYFVDRRSGLAIAVASTLTWFIADQLGGHSYSSNWVALWNTATRLVSFVVLAMVIAALRSGYDYQEELAHSDPLTGVRNRRRFLDLVEVEIRRGRRFGRPFTVAHFDLDGFKSVNDSLGHGEGDAVLRAVADAVRSNLRETDVVARLGGDEFAIVLTETGSDQARGTIEKLQRSLTEEMRKHRWPVTFSLGVLTCLQPPANADELMRRVDALTYSAKTEGKNTAVYEVVSGSSSGAPMSRE